MIYFLITGSSFFNFCFYIFAIGFVISLILEQVVKQNGNERDIFIVTTNRKFCWQQAWIVNLFWFLCNIGLYFVSRNMQPMADSFWDGAL